MRIELILIRDPDGGTDTELFLDGQRETDYDTYDIDAGRGYVWEDWTEHRDRCLAVASSGAVRSALADAFTDPPGSDYLDGRDNEPWLPGPLPGHTDTDQAGDTPGLDSHNTGTDDADDASLDRPCAINALLAAYHGDATVALLDLARQAGIAVHYLDRAALEAELGRPLTDIEWQRARPLLDGYDEWLDASGAAESISYWVHDVLARRAHIDIDDGPQS